jgi:hypothetical protein
MKQKFAKSLVSSFRCAHLTSDGRQCRRLASDAQSGLCLQHRAEQKQVQAADHFPYLSRNFQYFQTAQGINYSLMNLYQLLAQNRISPRRAAILSYISSLLLRTLPQIQSDKAAGIIDSTKFIDVSAADEDADTDSDEDSDLDPDEDADTDSETEVVTETATKTVTATETGTHLGSTNTWDPSIPEPDPKKKPS